MKKSIVTILLSTMLCFLLISFCGCSNAKKYTLTVIGDSDLLFEPLNKDYVAGETVTVKTDILNDATAVAIINGTPLQYTVINENSANAHWEFTFIMPDKNSTLELKTESGLLPPPATINNSIAYYNLALTYDSNIVGLKMNAYVHSPEVWEQIKLLIPSFTKSYDDDFFEQNALLVFFGQKGTGEGGKIERVNVELYNKKLYVDLYAKDTSYIGGAPCVMAEWVVVLEVENNIAFSDIIVNAHI